MGSHERGRANTVDGSERTGPSTSYNARTRHNPFRALQGLQDNIQYSNTINRTRLSIHGLTTRYSDDSLHYNSTSLTSTSGF
jgi:hypothetical protein